MNPEAKYVAHELPLETTDLLGELMSRLGLVYGAIDRRLTPQGHYVFLEINPAGQFLYVERSTSQPIAAAIAETLLGQPPLDVRSKRLGVPDWKLDFGRIQPSNGEVSRRLKRD